MLGSVTPPSTTPLSANSAIDARPLLPLASPLAADEPIGVPGETVVDIPLDPV